MATWSREHVVNFIELYHANECLWRLKSKDYNNRLKRDQAYQTLVNYVHTFEPEANKESVIKKISNLRNAYRKQLRKIGSKVSGADSEDLYEPKLWYFSYLEFLRDQELPKPACSSLEVENPDVKPLFTDDFEIPPSPQDEPDFTAEIRRCESPLPDPCTACSSSSSSVRPGAAQAVSRRAKRKVVEEELITLACDRLLHPPHSQDVEDEHDIFGKNIACKLRNLPREQRIHAEKLFSDVLYEAQLGTLSRNSMVVAHYDSGTSCIDAQHE